MKKYQLVVVGGGPGGYTAAFRAAELGMSVAIIDDNRVDVISDGEFISNGESIIVTKHEGSRVLVEKIN